MRTPPSPTRSVPGTRCGLHSGYRYAIPTTTSSNEKGILDVNSSAVKHRVRTCISQENVDVFTQLKSPEHQTDGLIKWLFKNS